MYAMHEYEILRQHTERMKKLESDYFHQSAALNARRQSIASDLIRNTLADMMIVIGKRLLRNGERMRYSVAR